MKKFDGPSDKPPGKYLTATMATRIDSPIQIEMADHQIHQLNHLVSRTLFHLMPSHSRLPQETRAVVMKQSAPDRIPRRHDAVLTIKPIPSSKDGQVLVKMTAA